MHSEWNQWIWNTLEIAPSDDERTVKRAYAKRLKIVRPDGDPEQFQALRQAYERALGLIQQAVTQQNDDIPVAAADADQAPATATAHDAISISDTESDRPAVDLHQEQIAWLESTQSRIDPSAAAEALWQALWQQLTLAEFSYCSAILREFMKADGFENFDVRDAFEFRAAHYCADQIADVTVRAAMVEHFRWTEDAQHLFHYHPELARTVLARYRADCEYKALKTTAVAGSLPALALLRLEPPKRSMRIYDRPFVAGMQALVQKIRWQSPELLHYRLNPEVFAWWESRVNTPRLTIQPAIFVLLIGAVIFCLLAALCASFIPENIKVPSLAIGFIAIELSVLWLTHTGIKRGKLQPTADRLTHWLQHARQSKWIQIGWTPLFALCTAVAMLDIRSEPLHWLISAGLTVCALASAFAAWRILTAIGVVIVFLLSTCFGIFGFEIFPGFGYLECNLIAVPIFITMVRGGEYYYGLLNFAENSLWKLRLGWLAIALFIYCLGTLTSPESYIVPAVAAWIWFLLGLSISNVYLGNSGTGVRVYAFGFVAGLASVFAIHTNSATSTTSAMMLTIAFFMCANLVFCKKEGRKFS